MITGSLGDLHNPPLGKSFSRLSKKLTHFHYTLCCNELWAKRDHLPDTVRYAWMHNLPGSEPGQPQGFQGQGVPLGSSATVRVRRARRWAPLRAARLWR